MGIRRLLDEARESKRVEGRSKSQTSAIKEPRPKRHLETAIA